MRAPPHAATCSAGAPGPARAPARRAAAPRRQHQRAQPPRAPRPRAAQQGAVGEGGGGGGIARQPARTRQCANAHRIARQIITEHRMMNPLDSYPNSGTDLNSRRRAAPDWGAPRVPRGLPMQRDVDVNPHGRVHFRRSAYMRGWTRGAGGRAGAGGGTEKLPPPQKRFFFFCVGRGPFRGVGFRCAQCGAVGRRSHGAGLETYTSNDIFRGAAPRFFFRAQRARHQGSGGRGGRARTRAAHTPRATRRRCGAPPSGRPSLPALGNYHGVSSKPRVRTRPRRCARAPLLLSSSLPLFRASERERKRMP